MVDVVLQQIFYTESDEFCAINDELCRLGGSSPAFVLPCGARHEGHLHEVIAQHLREVLRMDLSVAAEVTTRTSDGQAEWRWRASQLRDAEKRRRRRHHGDRDRGRGRGVTKDWDWDRHSGSSGRRRRSSSKRRR